MPSKELWAVIVVAIIAVSACAVLVHAGNGSEPERIGIIGAMDVEVSTLKDNMDITREETISGMVYTVGKLGGHDVVVVKCGMGKVNAGICAQTMIQSFNAKRIINAGVAGALDPRLGVGDYVVSTDVVQHDFDVTPIGFSLGEIPYTGLYSFKADDDMRKLAVTVIREVDSSTTVLEGRVCSGDQFIASDQQKETIVSNFGGLCCEMEGGAIAQVCYLNDVPFVILRTIADNADETPGEDYSEIERMAALKSVSIIIHMLTEM